MEEGEQAEEEDGDDDDDEVVIVKKAKVEEGASPRRSITTKGLGGSSGSRIKTESLGILMLIH